MNPEAVRILEGDPRYLLTQDLRERHLPIAYRPELKMKPEIPIADAVKHVEYLAGISKIGFKLLEKILPSVFVDTKCKYTFDPIHIGHEGAARVSSHDMEDEEGIVISFNTRPTPGHEGEDEVSAFSSTPELKLSRRIRDLLVFVHEYTHELYHHHISLPVKSIISQAISDKYFRNTDGKFIPDAHPPPDTEMVERVINEGLAIWAETQACIEISNDPSKYGFANDELQHVKTFIQARRLRFKENDEMARSDDPKINGRGRAGTCYNEGFAIVQSISETKGTEQVLELFSKIDPMKVAITERSSDDYIAVKSGTRSFLSVFGRKDTSLT